MRVRSGSDGTFRNGRCPRRRVKNYCTAVLSGDVLCIIGGISLKRVATGAENQRRVNGHMVPGVRTRQGFLEIWSRNRGRVVQ